MNYKLCKNCTHKIINRRNTSFNSFFFTWIYTVNLEITQMPYLLILGIGGFGLSLFFFIELLRIIGTLKTIVIFSSSAIFGLVLSFIILNEK